MLHIRARFVGKHGTTFQSKRNVSLARNGSLPRLPMLLIISTVPD